MDLLPEAGELDIGKGHREAGDRVQPSRPARQLAKLPDQAVVAISGLLERRPIEGTTAGPPSADGLSTRDVGEILGISGDRVARIDRESASRE